MPTLLETQRTLCRGLHAGDDAAAAMLIEPAGLAPEARVAVYRNTFIGTFVRALRLAFPAVHRLVGAEFFEGAARIFIDEHPPRSAYLDAYGESFPAFLEEFEPAKAVPYLAGVARLEWAVTCALHAPDAAALNVRELEALDPGALARVSFVAHPAVGLVRDDYPVDSIWRAVLSQDETAMSAIDLATGPAFLLVEALEAGVEVSRLDDAEWRFTSALLAGGAVETAIERAPGIEPAVVIAKHLLAGRFSGFTLAHRATAERKESTP